MIPLSTKMRPSTLDGFVGQTHFLFEGSLFYNSIKNKTFDSAIFFGPSGTGKTTLARIIARELDSNCIRHRYQGTEDDPAECIRPVLRPDEGDHMSVCG